MDTNPATAVTVPKQVPDVSFLQWNTLKKRKIELSENEDWDKRTTDYFERIQDDTSELWIEFVPIIE
jgi:chemotaxis regulatin CheY-phosphate phosphatase CheZ